MEDLKRGIVKIKPDEIQNIVSINFFKEKCKILRK